MSADLREKLVRDFEEFLASRILNCTSYSKALTDAAIAVFEEWLRETGRRIAMHHGESGDFDGGYDSIKPEDFNHSENSIGEHPGTGMWPGYVVRVVVDLDELASLRKAGG